MKIEELRSLSKDELIQKEKTLLEELYKFNQQRHSQRVEKPHNFLLLKRDIARIKTILNEKKRINAKDNSVDVRSTGVNS